MDVSLSWIITHIQRVIIYDAWKWDGLPIILKKMNIFRLEGRDE